MSWLSTLTEAVLAVALMMVTLVSASAAETLESAVMPGPLIQGHANLEGNCEKCHVRFDRSAQRGLCLDCHKPVAADVRGGSGYHGRLKDKECRTCHAEHKGRGAKVIQLDEAAFNHAQTDFSLRGKHVGKACRACHLAKLKYAQTPANCADCHRKDDNDKGHKGGLGEKCGTCHNEEGWKETRFDHAKTKFALRLAHADSKVKCTSCHVDNKFLNTPRDCVSCHDKTDNEKGHKGRFGPRCDKCHGETDWKQPTFRHERDTHFVLLDRHRTAKCDNCHRSALYKQKTPTRCYACHRGVDTEKGHRAALGDKCEKCHNAKSWKGTSFAHDRDTKFALRDKHLTAKCSSCHKTAGFADKLPLRCAACHQRDDHEKGHKASFGEKCENCHNARGFKPADFEHGRDAKFALQGRHAKLGCAACHRVPLYVGKTESRCYACHKKDDVHFASFDLQCEKCHVADNWRKIIKREGVAAANAAASLLNTGALP